MSTMNKNEIKATIQVGKKGITKGLIQNIEEQLLANKVVKIKVLKNQIPPEESKKDKVKNIAEEIIRRLNMKVKLVDVRGRTFTLLLLKK